MAINIYTNFKAMSWEKLICLKVLLECAPRGKIKHRWLLLRRVNFERKRRRKKGLIPKLEDTGFSDALNRVASRDDSTVLEPQKENLQ